MMDIMDKIADILTQTQYRNMFSESPMTATQVEMMKRAAFEYYDANLKFRNLINMQTALILNIITGQMDQYAPSGDFGGSQLGRHTAGQEAELRKYKYELGHARQDAAEFQQLKANLEAENKNLEIKNEKLLYDKRMFEETVSCQRATIEALEAAANIKKASFLLVAETEDPNVVINSTRDVLEKTRPMCEANMALATLADTVVKENRDLETRNKELEDAVNAQFETLGKVYRLVSEVPDEDE